MTFSLHLATTEDRDLIVRTLREESARCRTLAERGARLLIVRTDDAQPRISVKQARAIKQYDRDAETLLALAEQLAGQAVLPLVESVERRALAAEEHAASVRPIELVKAITDAAPVRVVAQQDGPPLVFVEHVDDTTDGGGDDDD